MLAPKAVRLDEKDRLIIIDQTRLPGELDFRVLEDMSSLVEAIAKLRVRGAPAIGIAAAYGVYILALKYATEKKEDFSPTLLEDIGQIRAVRPTAVNLAWALSRMEKVLLSHKDEETGNILAALKDEAINIDCMEKAITEKIAAIGEPLIKEDMAILTHCNAGWLATSGLGTALAPIYLAQKRGKRLRVYCDETRPLLQGARLTAYELMEARIDTTLLCDNMAASLMAEGKIDLIFVGADRVAANGDVANKIGTLSLAINAAYFGIPFYVCAPSSTFDPATAKGGDIVIEQRDGEEITKMWYTKSMAPEGTQVYNPAFDVTPHQLITGIITEDGIKKY